MKSHQQVKMSPAYLLLHLLSASIVIHGVQLDSATCNNDGWNKCSENLDSFIQKPEFPHMLTDKEIDTICKSILPETLECQNAFVEKCLNSSLQETWRNSSTIVQKVIDEACTHGEQENSTTCTLSSWNDCEKQIEKLPNVPLDARSPVLLASVCMIIAKSLECKEKFAYRCYSDDQKIKFKNDMDKTYSRLSRYCKLAPTVDCQKELQKCASQRDYLRTHNLLSATTESELQSICNSTSQNIACMKDFAEMCLDSEAKSQEQTEITVIERMTEAVCNPSDPFHERFLNYTVCYKPFATEYATCSSDFLRDKEMVQQPSFPRTLKRQKLCCSLERFHHCTRASIQSKCGKDIADTGEEILRFTTKDVENFCSEQKYDRSQCSVLYSTPTPSLDDAIKQTADACDMPLECLENIEYLETHGFKTAVTDDRLTRTCTMLQKVISCWTNYTKNCTLTPEVAKIKAYYIKMNPPFDRICKPGDPFRLRYLNFQGCYSSFASQFKGCENHFLQQDKFIFKLPISKNEKHEKFCCAIESFRHCLKTVIHRKCGKAIAATDQEMIALFFPKDIETACPLFRYNNPECPSFFGSSESASTLSASTSLMTTESINITSIAIASTTNPIMNTPVQFNNSVVPFSSFSGFYIFVLLYITNMNH